MALLSNKIAVVTGGAGGLGLAIVKSLGAEGAAGLSIDTRPAPADLPAGWHHRQCDVTSEAELGAAMQWAGGEFGQLDVAVANAGIVPPWRETAEIYLDDWDATFAVNVRGVMATIKHAIPLMKEGGGSIIAMGSLNSWQGHARQAAYVASKHAVHGLVRSAALDLGRFGIRVNALAPGPVATDALLARLASRAGSEGDDPDEKLREYAAATAMGRLATTDDVARAALYLASDMSSGVTGQLLPVDAGVT